MVSDTPRTDAVQYELLYQDTYTSWLEMSQTARQLERELNAAQDRIKRLEEAGDALFWAFMHPFDTANESIPDKWRKAKESKP